MRAKTTLIVLVLLLAAGCKTTYYHTRFPVLERPERPKLENVAGTEMKKMSPAAQMAVGDNFNKLLAYVKKLEIAVDEYNKFAEEKNKSYKGDDE
jgi:hypothetical protein